MSSDKNNERISYASTQNQLEYPDFLEVQLKSFMDFFQLDTTLEDRKKEGLFKVFSENFPISDTAFRSSFPVSWMLKCARKELARSRIWLLASNWLI